MDNTVIVLLLSINNDFISNGGLINIITRSSDKINQPIVELRYGDTYGIMFRPSYILSNIINLKYSIINIWENQ